MAFPDLTVRAIRLICPCLQGDRGVVVESSHRHGPQASRPPRVMDQVRGRIQRQGLEQRTEAAFFRLDRALPPVLRHSPSAASSRVEARSPLVFLAGAVRLVGTNAHATCRPLRKRFTTHLTENGYNRNRSGDCAAFKRPSLLLARAWRG